MINKKKKYIILLFMLILGLSVGFSLLQVNLKINGSSKIQGSSWDIHFENLNVTNGSVELSTGDVGATIQSSRTDITYTVTLNVPGDYYEFTVDAVNAGTVDGMVESVTSELNNEPITILPSYLSYSVTYETNDEIEINHLLKSGGSETYKVRIEYKRDIESTDMPITAQTLSLSFGVVYVQADSNGVEVEHSLNGIVYTVNEYSASVTNPKWNSVWLNEPYPETILYFETPTDVLSYIATNFGKEVPFYLKHKVENGIVTQQYVEFVVTDAMAQANPGMVPGVYALRGEKTMENDLSIVGEDYIGLYYEANKEVIKTAFGYATNPSRCGETTGDGFRSHFYCRVSGLYARTYTTGAINLYDTGDSYCSLNKDGRAHCLW